MGRRNRQLSVNQLATLSELVSRSLLAGLAGQQFSGKRDLYEILGYLKTEPTYDQYYARYRRQDIAGRIVDAPANATWRTPPTVTEDEEPGNTPFEADWGALVKRLRVYGYLSRVDRLAGIGRYAVVLIGVADGKALDQSLDAHSLRGPDDVLYLTPYSEKYAQIRTFVTDPQSDRFGKPEYYDIDLAGELKQVLAAQPGTVKVHWSRVLHVADGLLEDDIYGTPRLEGVYNLLDDLMKVVGGSAEMYWTGARQGLAAKANGPIGDPQKVQDELDEYFHGLRRFIRTVNMDITPLAGDIPKPAENVDAILSLIAGRTGIPKRILTGAEQGELASSQDETNWNARVTERRTLYAEPHCLRPLIDVLIAAGGLRAPAQEYTVTWPNLFEQSESEKADIAVKRTQALAAYSTAPGADMTVPPSEFRREFLGLPDEPAPEDLRSIQEEEMDEQDPEVREQFRRRAA